jgi:hypothetical protein
LGKNKEMINFLGKTELEFKGLYSNGGMRPRQGVFLSLITSVLRFPVPRGRGRSHSGVDKSQDFYLTGNQGAV